VEPFYTPQQLAEVNAYHAPGYLHSAIDAIAWPIVMVLIVRFLTVPLWRVTDRWARRASGSVAAALDRAWGDRSWLTTVLFANLLFLGFTVLDLPSDVYFGYLREHAYGMSRETPWMFVADLVKSSVVWALAVTALAVGMFGIARKLRSWWWIVGLVCALAMLGSAALDPYRSRLYLDQAPLPEGSLRTRITELMAKAHIDFRDVLLDKTSIHTVRVNAYFAGKGPTRTIVLTDSMLTAFTEDEILAAVAHESGHVMEPRWPGHVGTTLALFGFLGLVEWLFRRSAARGWFGITERADVRLLPLIVLLFDLAMDGAGPVSGWASRNRELEADRFAVQLTRDPEVFKTMLVKLARINKADPTPPRWYVLKGMSHPPMAERLAAVPSALP
jgi:STE24 endopeptidase